MTRLIKPERLHKGDTIATISPSWGCAGSFEPYSIKLREVISGKYGLNELPVMGDVNFGHTSPIFILPYGAEARLDVDKLRFDITENGVV